MAVKPEPVETKQEAMLLRCFTMLPSPPDETFAARAGFRRCLRQ